MFDVKRAYQGSPLFISTVRQSKGEYSWEIIEDNSLDVWAEGVSIFPSAEDAKDDAKVFLDFV